MARKGKVGRTKRKNGQKSGSWSVFVKNKWDGKEPVEEFWKREFKAWNNLPSQFKSPFRNKLVK